MKFTISDKTLRRVLVGVAVVTILLLIFFRVRSKYQYPDTTAATKNPATISVVTPVVGVGGAPTVVTITTSGPHGYSAGDVLLYGSASPPSSYVVLSSPAVTTTTFAINYAGTPAAATTNFTVGSTFTPAYKTLTDALDQCNITNQNNPNPQTFDTCIRTQTEAYVRSMCPWTDTNNTPTQSTAPATVWQAKQDFDNDITAIKTAYTALQNSVSTDLTPVLNAARRADLTGATRRYLSTACPNYYVPATGGSAPAAYTAWRAIAATAAGATGTLPSPVPATYFDGSRVGFTTTAQKTAVLNRLKEWAKYATSDTAGTTPLVPSCTLHTGGTAPNLNWKLAQQYGPGTVTTAATLPWNSTVATCPAPGTWTLS